MSRRIAITLGDPGGIGPDICVMMAKSNITRNHILLTDPRLLLHSSKKLKIKIKINLLKSVTSRTVSGLGVINVYPLKLKSKNKPGYMDPKNASFVIDTIQTAAEGCLRGDFDAMVTGPISKSVLNRGGYKVSGHTEFLAKLCKSKSIMMLMNDRLRVTLQTIHIPLKNITKEITKNKIIETVCIINKDLKTKFGITKPKILICGINPHAGEDGLLGKEEIDIIMPAVKSLKTMGIKIDGPIPADTAFI